MKRSWNPSVWLGFVLVFVGMLSYPLFFARFPATRDFPWANLLIIALALLLLGWGVARAFRQPDLYRGKIFAASWEFWRCSSWDSSLSKSSTGRKKSPHRTGLRKAGDICPDFTLPDSQGNSVTLSAVLNSPFAPNGPTSAAAATGSVQTARTVFIFYRGYW